MFGSRTHRSRVESNLRLSRLRGTVWVTRIHRDALIPPPHFFTRLKRGTPAFLSSTPIFGSGLMLSDRRSVFCTQQRCPSVRAPLCDGFGGVDVVEFSCKTIKNKIGPRQTSSRLAGGALRVERFGARSAAARAIWRIFGPKGAEVCG